MTAAAEQVETLTLSGKFLAAEDEPLTSVGLLEACELYESSILKAKVAISEAGGARRIRVRPVIKSVGNASGVEVADQLHAIAWTDVKKHGKPRRYLAELDVEGEAQPIRVYFDLSPDVTVFEVEGNTSAPSLEYVRGLEQLVLTLSTNASRVAVRQGMNEERRINAVWAGLERESNLEVAKGANEIARLTAEGKNRRTDKVLDGVVGLLPKLADRMIGELGSQAGAVSAEGTPIERVTKIVSAEQLAALEKALGSELWVKLSAAPDIPTLRDLLAGMSLEVQAAMLEAIGRDHIMTIAGWK